MWGYVADREMGEGCRHVFSQVSHLDEEVDMGFKLLEARRRPEASLSLSRLILLFYLSDNSYYQRFRFRCRSLKIVDSKSYSSQPYLYT